MYIAVSKYVFAIDPSLNQAIRLMTLFLWIMMDMDEWMDEKLGYVCMYVFKYDLDLFFTKAPDEEDGEWDDGGDGLKDG